MTDIFAELAWRRLIHQTTDDENLPRWLSQEPRTVYAGFDPTADSLQVGNLVGVMALRRFQQAGHRPIALVGGATGMVGDPSGKSEERNLLSVDALQANVAAVKQQLARFLDFDCGTNSALLVNNYDWMGGLGYLDFLRDVGKHFPVNVMLTKESVKSRLQRTDSGLSYTEFSYMLLQAYDFAYLNKHYDCYLQIGGSDQWGNITAGIDLARRLRSVQLYGITWPLLTESDGSKMGKTESGALWLSAEKTSPYHFYQYWINLDDADVGICLRFLTDLDRDEIDSLLAEHESEPGRRHAQRRLAAELARLVHGRDGLTTAQRATEMFFGAEITQLTDAGLSYTEFSYMLLQAYDFVHLSERYGCELQIGGSDQWGNVTAGIDLARRMRSVQLYGLTWPLLTKSDGSKMGKTESGSVWLDPERTSPYHFYQYWINLEDAGVGMCLRYFTDLGQETIEALLAEHEADPGRRVAQRRLAVELTRIVHNDDGLATAERATKIFFGAEISDLSDAQLQGIFADVPSRQLPRERLTGDGLSIIDAISEAGLAKSKGEARRIITQGGAYVNNRRVEGIETTLSTNDLVGQSTIVLRSGKKKYALLRFDD